MHQGLDPGHLGDDAFQRRSHATKIRSTSVTGLRSEIAWTTRVARVLRGHKLKHEVLEIIDQAEEYVILATAYLSLWPDLMDVLRRAVRRGVDVRLVIRESDGRKEERAKKEQAIKEMQAAGVTVESVRRLHAKVYVNESQMVLTSFNLVAASHESVELGMWSNDRVHLDDTLDFLKHLVPSLETVGESKKAEPARTRRAARTSSKQSSPTGFCIGCGNSHPFNVEKPLCRVCYRTSKRAMSLGELRTSATRRSRRSQRRGPRPLVNLLLATAGCATQQEVLSRVGVTLTVA